jgi:allantoin racemase
MHIASMLGNKFSVIDLAESHNMYYYNLVVQHHFTQRCASIRNINDPLPRPGCKDHSSILKERDKAQRGEPSEAVEIAAREAVAAIEEDGAEVITFGCSATFWLQPFVQKRLHEMG